MKDFFSHWTEIQTKLSKRQGVLLLLDFDGTLSPIAPTPAQAVLPKNIKAALKNFLKYRPAAIISGRGLGDIKKKVGIKGIVYAGSHGLVWQVGKKANRIPGLEQSVKNLLQLKKKLHNLPKNFPGVILESKDLGLAVHYRMLAAGKVAAFRSTVIKQTLPYMSGMRIQKGKKVIEFLPDFDWNKGKCALFLWKFFEKKSGQRLVPVYIGDDITDESAFAALRRGITVRVGRSRRSGAEYFIKNPSKIFDLLALLNKSESGLQSKAGQFAGKRRKLIVVNDKMQKDYRYELVEPEGRNFDPEFRPELTPKQMLELGVFGGRYLRDCKKEFPAAWFKRAKLLPPDLSGHDPKLNFFGVDASQPLKVWQKNDWIHPQDPRGWFQWYCRYYLGRRNEDDQRQIKRWLNMKRHISQLKKYCRKGDTNCRRGQRQALLHWAYDSRKI